MKSLSLIFFFLIPRVVLGREICAPNPFERETFFNLKEFSSHVSLINNCSELQVGSARIIQSSEGNLNHAYKMANQFFPDQTYTPPNNSNYLLYRKSENDFEIVFNLNFIPSNNDPSLASKEYMLARAKQCMGSVNGSLRGPGGRNISLRITSPESVANQIDTEPSKRVRKRMSQMIPPAINIEILPETTGSIGADGVLTAASERGSANRFPSDFSCAHIVHELLHHAGLCDEFIETNTSDQYKQAEGTCRMTGMSGALEAAGPTDSIMGRGMDFIYESYIGEPLVCEIPESTGGNRILASIQKNLGTPLQDYLLIKRFDDISLPPEYFSLPPNGGSPQDLFCTTTSQTFNSSGSSQLINTPYTRIRSFNSSSLSFEYLTRPNLNFEFDESNFTIEKKKVDCHCPEDSPYNANCKLFLNTLNAELVPLAQETSKIYKCPFGTRPQYSNEEMVPGATNIEGRKIFMRSQPAQRESGLLYPAQFLRLINGECEIQNSQTDLEISLLQKYNACARFTRLISREVYDNRGRSRNFRVLSCQDRPQFCYDPASWLGTLN